jgi:rare lipoprotein A
MKRRTKVLLAVVLGLQLYCTPLMKAEQATGIGSDEISQSQTALMIDSKHTQEPPGTPTVVDTVIATYYSRRFHGRKTASGDRYDRLELTCAHKTLPFNTLIKVTNPRNNKSVVVRVNDRGPFKKNRKLDLSYAAAKEIDLIHAGVMPVIMEVLPYDSLDIEQFEG